MKNINQFIKKVVIVCSIALLAIATSKSYGMIFVSGSEDGIIKIWRVVGHKFECIQTLDEKSGGHQWPVNSVAFNKYGLLVSGSWDNTIKIWRPNKNNQFTLIQTSNELLGGHIGCVNSVAFNKYGLLVSGSWDKTIKIWQPSKDNQKGNQFTLTQTLDELLGGHTGSVNSIAFNKDGLLVSGSLDNTIKIWQPNKDNQKDKQFTLIQTLDEKSGGHTDWVMSVAFNTYGLLASGSWDKTIKIWQANKGNQFTLTQTLDEKSGGHTGYVNSVAFNKYGLLISGSLDKTIKIWRPDKDNQFTLTQTLDEKSGGHTDYVRSIAFNKYGLLVSGSCDKTIKIWRPSKDKQFKCIQTLGGHTNVVLSIVFMPEKKKKWQFKKNLEKNRKKKNYTDLVIKAQYK